ncbi:hypothetical protein A9Q99_21735 [Gammaproteobacteria bacterium 45_16_T64]|nr:hypothetical protein A9Q99_21735 [Gammaproteobacteria bacterium 45_16_T64]
MKHVRNQKGMTLLSMAMLGTLVGFVGFFGFSLYGPLYDDQSVKTIVENVAADPKARGQSTKVVRKLILKRLNVNRVDLDKKYIILEKTKDGMNLAIDYEVRVDFISNISLVASFSHHAVIPK